MKENVGTEVRFKSTDKSGAFVCANRESQSLSGDSDDSGVCKKSRTYMNATTSADFCKANATNTSTKKVYIKTCVGIIIIQSTYHKKEISLYNQYTSVSSKAKYKFGFYGERPQLFANNCTGTGGIGRY